MASASTTTTWNFPDPSEMYKPGEAPPAGEQLWNAFNTLDNLDAATSCKNYDFTGDPNLFKSPQFSEFTAIDQPLFENDYLRQFSPAPSMAAVEEVPEFFGLTTSNAQAPFEYVDYSSSYLGNLPSDFYPLNDYQSFFDTAPSTPLAPQLAFTDNSFAGSLPQAGPSRLSAFRHDNAAGPSSPRLQTFAQLVHGPTIEESHYMPSLPPTPSDVEAVQGGKSAKKKTRKRVTKPYNSEQRRSSKKTALPATPEPTYDQARHTSEGLRFTIPCRQPNCDAPCIGIEGLIKHLNAAHEITQGKSGKGSEKKVPWKWATPESEGRLVIKREYVRQVVQHLKIRYRCRGIAKDGSQCQQTRSWRSFRRHWKEDHGDIDDALWDEIDDPTK
ncbi:hypothetical protein CPB84DRAFT_968296 [Gymnopilus junonius]|uniref:Uncharacterized protein n=1 Tax=Gymnopilus junonius TaxID=109634 RepID=A0A9P5NR94_GYMJU|nr:hypothetical protein CPB84DRAFT_968296 [Gymnopilus junonius]